MHSFSGFQFAPSIYRFEINAPSFGCSVISLGSFGTGTKSNSNLSIGAPLAFLLNLYKRDVVNPFGKVKQPIQKWNGIPFIDQFVKNSYLSQRSANQLARGLIEK